MRSDRSARVWMMLLAMALAGCDRAPVAPEAAAHMTDRSAQALSEQRSERERQTAWLQLGDGQRQRIRDAATAFAALPADEQTRLRAEFSQMDRAEQRGWRLGPDIGAAWPQLSPLFSYVSEDERAPLLAILRDMNADELQALGRIAWRTPPERRDALRRELIGLPVASMPAWLASAAER